MSATLTERYVSAATRHVPAKERADAREKLETSIAGSVVTRPCWPPATRTRPCT